MRVGGGVRLGALLFPRTVHHPLHQSGICRHFGPDKNWRGVYPLGRARTPNPVTTSGNLRPRFHLRAGPRSRRSDNARAFPGFSISIVNYADGQVCRYFLIGNVPGST